MTEEQKTQIADLRSKGAGYKKIAQTIGLSENTVKSFCRRMALPKAEPISTGDVTSCECCGKPMEQIPGRKKRRFCSTACRQKWWNGHLELVQRKAIYRLKCHHCGREFEVYGNRHRKYCCHECYIAERFGGRKSGTSPARGLASRRCACVRTKPSVAVGGERP